VFIVDELKRHDDPAEDNMGESMRTHDQLTRHQPSALQTTEAPRQQTRRMTEAQLAQMLERGARVNHEMFAYAVAALDRMAAIDTEFPEPLGSAD
jgi:hypothetical protein